MPASESTGMSVYSCYLANLHEGIYVDCCYLANLHEGMHVDSCNQAIYNNVVT